ncbi:MAG: hypothetical protein IKZ58_02885 [Selenomonadaceae bacterium]|nr:hypothetical protein [Selenomonadaceae bacterium]
MELEDKKLIENSILFDADWYKQTYGFGKYLDAAKHYLEIGWREGKEPSTFFSAEDYFAKNLDVKDADINPLLHFEKYGFKEGRYKPELKKVMPQILKRHPECYTDLSGGILRIRITNACNAKCRYCGVRLGFGDEVNHAMTPSWYYELCKPLYEKISLVLVTGGDAFFAKESYNYMKFMSENFPKITVITESNGIAFNEKCQRIACENLFKTHFSINASNAEIFAKSCWDRDDGETARKIFPFMIRNIESYLKKLAAENKLCFAPSLSMVINKDNASDILNFIELALKLHAIVIGFYFDYIENDMSSDYFTNPDTSRPAMKTLMELERVLAEKVGIYFRLWLPVKEAGIIQQEVEAIPIDELNRKYAKILKLAEGRSIIGELNQRNEFRRKYGKSELSLVDDISPTLHLQKNGDVETCFAPWNEIDLYPDGRMDFCGWFQPTLNIKNFIQVKDGKEFVNWDEILNSYEYVSARYRILHNDFEGCQVCCPMNSVKNPVEACTKYTLDRGQ